MDTVHAGLQDMGTDHEYRGVLYLCVLALVISVGLAESRPALGMGQELRGGLQLAVPLIRP